MKVITGKNLIVRIMPVGKLDTNCCIISNSISKETLILDPGGNQEEIASLIKKKELNPVAILLTHGHFDHIMAVDFLAKEFDIPVYAGENEQQLLMDPHRNCSSFFQMECVCSADELLADGQIVNIGGLEFQYLHTPGHTQGSGCYYFEKEGILFSGDTIFYESVGRTDFPTGNHSLLIRSIQNKILVLPDNVKIFPGHGEETSVGHEKENNSYLE